MKSAFVLLSVAAALLIKQFKSQQPVELLLTFAVASKASFLSKAEFPLWHEHMLLTGQTEPRYICIAIGEHWSDKGDAQSQRGDMEIFVPIERDCPVAVSHVWAGNWGLSNWKR